MRGPLRTENNENSFLLLFSSLVPLLMDVFVLRTGVIDGAIGALMCMCTHTDHVQLR